MIATSRTDPGGEAQRRLVPCGGHAFDENLVCRCHTSWWSHQQRPKACPMDARRHNCHPHDDESEQA
jgi:hypothetical protein